MKRWKPEIYLLILLLVLGLWDWTTRISTDIARKEEQARTLPPEPELASAIQSQWAPDFGDLVPATESQAEAEPEEDNFAFPDGQSGDELELADSNRLRLMATSLNQGGRMALVREVSSAGKEATRYLLAPGDQFRGISVNAIAHGYVELAYEGRRFRLTIFEQGGS